MEDTKRLDILTQKLRQNGHRLTPQRMAVLEILAVSRDHPSVEEIYDQVKSRFPMTSLGTVYKTVEVLKELGEILELGFANQGSRYDGARPHPHPHLICTQCGKIIDPDVSMMEDLARVVAQQTGFQIVTHRLDFYGICPNCNDGQEASAV